MPEARTPRAEGCVALRGKLLIPRYLEISDRLDLRESLWDAIERWQTWESMGRQMGSTYDAA